LGNNHLFSQGGNISGDIDLNNCKRLKINGKMQCIDSTVFYFPEVPNAIWLDSACNYHKSMDLNIFGESKWYNEKNRKDGIRICLMDCSTCHDSVYIYVLSNFNGKDSLLKKSMIGFSYYDLWRGGILPNLRDEYSYNTTTKFISSKKVNRLKKTLKKLDSIRTFDNYAFESSLVIEYVSDGKYHLIISREPTSNGLFNFSKKTLINKRLYRVLKWLNSID
jgi:hypothetical protein